MTQLLFMLMSLAVGLIFTQMTHPLAMGLILLFQTLIIALMTGLMASTFWFSYILFLVFLGGMLVLFIYVTSLASNEMFSISSFTLILSLLFLGTLSIVMLINDPLVWLAPVISDQTLTLDFMPLNDSTPSLLIKLYNSPSSILTLLLVVYLFLTLVAVVSITNIFEGPLRSKY